MGTTVLPGKGTTCDTAMPVASSPMALSVAAAPMMDKAYSGSPLRCKRIALTKSIVGLPARPTSTASGLELVILATATLTSAELLSTVTMAVASSLCLAMDSCAASNTSLPKALCWQAMAMRLMPMVARCCTSCSASSA